MSEPIRGDICVIGAGSGGLSVAAGASQMGASTILLERHRMGGDCLNTGCVPSKALLAAAHAAHQVRRAQRFGVVTAEPTIDMGAVHDHVQGVIARIAPHDSVERFQGLGVNVIEGEGRFLDETSLAVNGRVIKARRFVIATGSSPAIPAIEGLAEVPFFTNETLFDNRQLPEHLVVIGGGPIGLEMAQGYRRLGARVTVLVRSRLLPKDDPELSEILAERLRQEGIRLLVGLEFIRVEGQGGGVAVHVRHQGEAVQVQGSHLLVSAGRTPNMAALDLERAGIAFTQRGITVDRRLRTSNKRVFAIGDVAGPHLFTHAAGYHAGIVVRNVLFRQPAKVDYRALPWVTYTDPEVAQVGLTEDQARKQGLLAQVLRKSMADNDRARAEGETDGVIKVILGKGGRILGVSLAAAMAGELIQPWILAISQQLKIGAMATFIAPYPTRGEINKGVAGSYYTPSLFSERTRKVVRLLARLG